MFHVPQPFPHLWVRKGGAQVGGCLVSMSLTDCFFTMAVPFLEFSIEYAEKVASWIYILVYGQVVYILLNSHKM